MPRLDFPQLAAAGLGAALLVGGVASPAPADDAGLPPYPWSLSASDTYPFENSGTPTDGTAFLYLWILPGGGPGWEHACFDLAGTGMTILGTTASFGIQYIDGCFFNPSCAGNPTIVATVLVLDEPGDICFAPSSNTGTNCTWDCGLVPPGWRNSWIGYTNQSPIACADSDWGPCGTVGVTPGEWGRIKAGYR